MAKTYNRMNIDIDSNVLSAVTGVQLDSQSRFLDVSLYANSAAIDLTGHTVRLLVRKEDGTVSYVQGEVKEPVNGRCLFELTNQMLAKVGWLELQIELWQGTSVLSTNPFKLYVVETLRNEEEVESTNEYGALVVLFQEIQDSLDLMRKMTDSFGLPGQKAAQFGVDSFWGMLEILAERADTKELLKQYINSTIDKASFKTLDMLVKEVRASVATMSAKVNTLSSDMKTGGVPIIRHIQRGTVLRRTVDLTGFTNSDKMVALLHGGLSGRGGYNGEISVSAPSVVDLNTTRLIVDNYEKQPSYQVIEFY